MSKFKFIKQLDAKDCGPTCLVMVLNYHGIKVSRDYIREIMYINKQGVSLLSISKTAENIGFKTVATKLDLTNLISKVTYPSILHWNQNHFVVLYNIKKKKGKYYFRIADPGKGLLECTEEDMSKKWLSSKINSVELGILLVLEPTPQLTSFNIKHKPKISKLGFFLRYLKQYNYIILQLLLGTIISSVLLVFLPYLTKSLIDRGVHEKNISIVWIILIAQGLFIRFMQQRTCLSS